MEYKNGKITQIEDPDMGMDSYLGMKPKVAYFYLTHSTI